MTSLLRLTSSSKYFGLNNLATNFVFYTGLSFTTIAMIASFVTASIIGYSYRENIFNFLKNFSIFFTNDKTEYHTIQLNENKGRNINENLIDRLVIIKKISKQTMEFLQIYKNREYIRETDFDIWIKADVNKDYFDIILNFNKNLKKIDNTKIEEYKNYFEELDTNPEKMKNFLVSNSKIKEFIDANIYKIENIMNIYKAKCENFNKEHFNFLDLYKKSKKLTESYQR